MSDSGGRAVVDCLLFESQLTCSGNGQQPPVIGLHITHISPPPLTRTDILAVANICTVIDWMTDLLISVTDWLTDLLTSVIDLMTDLLTSVTEWLTESRYSRDMSMVYWKETQTSPESYKPLLCVRRLIFELPDFNISLSNTLWTRWSISNHKAGPVSPYKALSPLYWWYQASPALHLSLENTTHKTLGHITQFEATQGSSPVDQ